MKKSALESFGVGLETESKPAALRINLDDITPDPSQPRTFTGDPEEQEALRDLAQSILAHGVIQPIAVRPAADPGKYVLVSGERRYRASHIARQSGEACQRAGYDLNAIPAIIIEPKSDADRLEMQLVENIAREDMSSEDVSRSLRTLLGEPGVTRVSLASRLGRSEAWIRQVLSYSDPVFDAAVKALGIESEQVSDANVASRLVAWQRDTAGRARLLPVLKSLLESGSALTQGVVAGLDASYRVAESLDAPSLVEAMDAYEFSQLADYKPIFQHHDRDRLVPALMNGRTVEQALAQAVPAAQEAPAKPSTPAAEPSEPVSDQYAVSDDAAAHFEQGGVDDVDEAELMPPMPEEEDESRVSELGQIDAENAFERDNKRGQVAAMLHTPNPNRVTVQIDEALAQAVCEKAGVEYIDSTSVIRAIEALSAD